MPTQSTDNVVWEAGCDDSDGKAVIAFQSKVVDGKIKDGEDGAVVTFDGDKEVTIVGYTTTVIKSLTPGDRYTLPRHEVQMGMVYVVDGKTRLLEHTGRRTCPPSELKPGQQTW